MNYKKRLMGFARQKRGIVALEAAIILIAFVLIAGVFSFMVINQGLFASDQSKSAIQQSLTQASTSLSVDGSIYVKSDAAGTNITGIVIPLKAIGLNEVSVDSSTTTLSFEANGAITPNIYNGVSALDDADTYDTMLTATTAGQGSIFIPNGATTNSMTAGTEGYLVISASATNEPAAGTQVSIEIDLQQTAPVTIQFTVPTSLPASTWVSV